MNPNQDNSNIKNSQPTTNLNSKINQQPAPQQTNNQNLTHGVNADAKEQRKQEDHEASAKTAHAIGKGAATYFGGTVGNRLYDAASKTKLGKAIESQAGKALERSPMGMTAKPAMRALNKSGALDVADQAIDAVGTGKGGTPSVGKTTPNTNSDMLKGSNAKTGQIVKNISSSRPINNQGYSQTPSFYEEDDIVKWTENYGYPMEIIEIALKNAASK